MKEDLYLHFKHDKLGKTMVERINNKKKYTNGSIRITEIFSSGDKVRVHMINSSNQR